MALNPIVFTEKVASVPLITTSQPGIGFGYLFEPGNSSVITSVGPGDPAGSGFGAVVHGDD